MFSIRKYPLLPATLRAICTGPGCRCWHSNCTPAMISSRLQGIDHGHNTNGCLAHPDLVASIPPTATRSAQALLPTRHGDFMLISYNGHGGKENIALVVG